MTKINRDARRQVGRASAWALALVCSLPTTVLADKQTTKIDSDCGCTSPYRTFDQAPTAMQQALFEAARRADVDTFMRLLPVSAPLGDLAIDGEPILTAIISPNPELKSNDRDRGRAHQLERDRLYKEHRATHDARLRMLRAALAKGARPSDVTYQHRIPALQLAIAFGPPEMVDALLRHGADPRQANEDEHLTPLEFLLDHEFFQRRRGLPEMLTREERARVAASLTKAGSPDPRVVNWTELVTLTSGDRWIKHLLARRKPSTQELMTTGNEALPTAAAAYFGDRAALRPLLGSIPRFETSRYLPKDQPPFDLQLDAAIAAIHGGHTALARSLLNKGMNWTQVGPRGAPRLGSYAKLDVDGQQTVLEAAIHRGDLSLARQLLDWGSPVDASLVTAVQRKNEAMIRLLVQRGANPVKNPPGRYGETPLELAVKQAPELLPALLEHPSKATRQALNEAAQQLLRSAFENTEPNLASNRPLIEALLKAGVSGPSLSPAILHWAILAGDTASVDALHAANAPWPPDAVADAMSSGQLTFIEHVSKLSGQPLSNSCPLSYESLIRLVREAPPFAERLLDQGLQIGSCSQRGPLSHRLLQAWGARESRPLMGTRYQRAQALLQRLRQSDPAQRSMPKPLVEKTIALHRPDLLGLALDAAPLSPEVLSELASFAIENRNPDALRLMRAHGLTGDALLPNGQSLAWLLSCERPIGWLALAGFSDQETSNCPSKAVKPRSPTETALISRLPGRYYLSGVREVGSELNLSADGRYTNATSYGAVDLFVQGRWHVEGEEVILQGEDALPAPPFRILKAWHEPGVDGVEVRASSDGRLMQGFIVMSVGSERSYIGKLNPRDEEGWTSFGAGAPSLGRLEGLAMGVAHGDSMRWGLMPLSQHEQGRMPNRIEVDINRSTLTPPSRTVRMRLDNGDLVSTDNVDARGRYHRASGN